MVDSIGIDIDINIEEITRENTDTDNRDRTGISTSRLMVFWTEGQIASENIQA